MVTKIFSFSSLVFFVILVGLELTLNFSLDLLLKIFCSNGSWSGWDVSILWLGCRSSTLGLTIHLLMKIYKSATLILWYKASWFLWIWLSWLHRHFAVDFPQEMSRFGGRFTFNLWKVSSSFISNLLPEGRISALHLNNYCYSNALCIGDENATCKFASMVCWLAFSWPTSLLLFMLFCQKLTDSWMWIHFLLFLETLFVYCFSGCLYLCIPAEWAPEWAQSWKVCDDLVLAS